MKLKLAFNCILILFSLVLTQCTIQKRTVNKGYFVQWYFNKKAVSAKQNTPKESQNDLVLRSEIQQDDTTFREHELLIDDFHKVVQVQAEIKPSKEKINSKNNLKTKLRSFSSKKETLSNFKHNLKDPQENKDPIKQKILLTMLIALLTFILGLILVIYAFSKSYLVAWAFIFGFGFCLLGTIVFGVSLLSFIGLSIYRFQKSKENKVENGEMKKPLNKAALCLALVGLVLFLLSFLTLPLGLITILRPIFFFSGIGFIILAILFSIKDRDVIKKI